MSEDVDKEVCHFVGKYARSYLAFPYLLQAVLGLGDKMLDDYGKLSDEAQIRTCKWCANVVSNYYKQKDQPK